MREHGQVKALGAGLLFSCTEIARVTCGAELLPFGPQAMAERAYDPTDLQPVLFVAESFEGFAGGLWAWLLSSSG